MAQSNPEIATKQGLDILKESPAFYSGVLCKLRQCHDLCVYSGVPILSREVQSRIEQSSVDFRHVCIQTATLAERVGSNWCATCILFFANLDKIKGDPSKILDRISKQAGELSEGFTLIAEWVRFLAGRFHDCGQLAGKDKEIYMEKVTQALEENKEAKKKADAERQKALAAVDEARDSANRWGIAAMIPVVNIIALPVAVMRSGNVQDAREDNRRAEEALSAAMKSLKLAESNLEKAEAAADHVADLVKLLGEVERICEGQAAFWSFQSDKFGSFKTSVSNAKDLIEIGLIDESTDELIGLLRERKGELENYHVMMQAVNNSFNFPTGTRRPTEFPSINLPALDITLE